MATAIAVVNVAATPIPLATGALTPLPASVVTIFLSEETNAEDGYHGLVSLFSTYRKLNALALFVIAVVRFIRALLVLSAAVYLNEGTGVALYTTSGAAVEEYESSLKKFAKEFALAA
jgi:hypothetical protein